MSKITEYYIMFKNRFAVITGSAWSIGRAIADALAEHGCNVVISDINAEGYEKTTAREYALRNITVTGITPCYI